MSLNVDPHLTVNLIKTGKLSGPEAVKEIKNLLSEVSSGIYTLDQMGLRSEEELEGLKNIQTEH
jgi:hypothetical protein